MLSRIAILMSGAARNPVLSLNFLEMTTLDQLIDFTRTSAATYVDATGKIVSTPASRNLLTFTQEFNNAAWAKTAATVTANAATAPDGTLTADKLIENTATGSHRIYQGITTSSIPYTASAYLKKGERNWAYIRLDDSTSVSRHAWFNLDNGSVGTVETGLTATISSVGNGWYRCSARINAALAGTSNILFGMASADNVQTYTGDGTSGVFLWGAQLEANTTATDYTRNFGGVFPPRFDYDPVTLAPRGLLVEEQRTNLLTYSEEFDNAAWSKTNITVSANAILSPNGNTTADKIEATASAVTILARTISVAATSAVASIYIKKGSGAGDANKFGIRNSTTATNLLQFTFNYDTGAISYLVGTSGASATDAGGGWWRLTFTASSGITSGDSLTVWYGFWGSGETAAEFAYFWGAQLEAGAFATSYIPTVASQVTRTADVATITGANFSQWYNQSEGTFVVDADSGGNVALIPIYRVLSAGGGGDTISLFMYNSKWGGAVRVGGVVQADLQVAGTYTANVPAKTSFAFKANDFAASVNGSAVLTDTSGTIPTVAALNLGSEGGSAPLNGHIRSIRYYNTRLPNAQLQALTA